MAGKTVKKAAKPAKAKPAKTKTKPANAKAKPAKAAPLVASPAFQAVLDALLPNAGVARARMFGADGIGIGGKFFAMEHKGRLVVKLPVSAVDQLVSAGTGVRFDPGMGRPMKEWISVAPGATDWVDLSERALTYVASLL